MGEAGKAYRGTADLFVVICLVIIASAASVGGHLVITALFLVAAAAGLLVSGLLVKGSGCRRLFTVALALPLALLLSLPQPAWRRL